MHITKPDTPSDVRFSVLLFAGLIEISFAGALDFLGHFVLVLS